MNKYQNLIGMIIIAVAIIITGVLIANAIKIGCSWIAAGGVYIP